MTRTNRFLILGLVAAGLVATAACGAQATAVSERRGEHDSRPPVAVDVVRVVPGDVTESIDVVGSLAPKFFADVKSEVTGTVTAVEVTEWVPVRKGAPLARLDTTETDAAIDALRAVAAQARVHEARARRERDRALELQRYGLITTQALDEAAYALDAATAATTASAAQMRTAEARLAKSSIRSPMDGVVALRRVNVGDRVENMGGGEPMFRIVDARLLELTASVPASRLSDLRVGQALEFTTDGAAGRTFSGRVMFINPIIDQSNRSVKVVAEVPNGRNELKGGSFVRGRIVTALRRGVVQVPRDALVDWNVPAGTAAVFVLVEGPRVVKRPVTTAATTEQGVEITGGLAAGEQVVTRGVFALHSGDEVIVSGDEGGT